TLLALGVGLALLLPHMPAAWLDLLSDAPTVAALGGTQSLGFRGRVWTMALWGLADFPFTGMGLGTFREIGPLFYNLDIPANYDIAHAHNLFLQTGLDFGLLGMVCLIAVYLAAGVQLVGSWASLPQARPWVIGLAGSLAGQFVFAQLDAVALGAKTNFMFWYWLALVFALGNLAARAD
ncbi:MAG: O-antigen ligase family protein, partial [Caldilineaceae bacterium]|nr:O-antigen ligase family protein [Caldilineaceae bacterium]